MTAALSCDRCGRSPVSQHDWLHCDECWQDICQEVEDARAGLYDPPVVLHDFSPSTGYCYRCIEHISAAGVVCEPATWPDAAEPEGMA